MKPSELVETLLEAIRKLATANERLSVGSPIAKPTTRQKLPNDWESIALDVISKDPCIKQKDLAEHFGVSAGHLSRAVKGSKEVSEALNRSRMLRRSK